MEIIIALIIMGIMITVIILIKNINMVIVVKIINTSINSTYILQKRLFILMKIMATIMKMIMEIVKEAMKKITIKNQAQNLLKKMFIKNKKKMIRKNLKARLFYANMMIVNKKKNVWWMNVKDYNVMNLVLHVNIIKEVNALIQNA